MVAGLLIRQEVNLHQHDAALVGRTRDLGRVESGWQGGEQGGIPAGTGNRKRTDRVARRLQIGGTALIVIGGLGD